MHGIIKDTVLNYTLNHYTIFLTSLIVRIKQIIVIQCECFYCFKKLFASIILVYHQATFFIALKLVTHILCVTELKYSSNA